MPRLTTDSHEVWCPEHEGYVDHLEYRVEVVSRELYRLSPAEVAYGSPASSEPAETDVLDSDRDGATFTCPECGEDLDYPAVIDGEDEPEEPYDLTDARYDDPDIEELS